MGCFSSKEAVTILPPEGKLLDDWSEQEVAGWYGTLVSNVQKYRAILLPEEGCVVARWDEKYLTSKGVPSADAMRIITYRDKAAARAAKAAAASGKTASQPNAATRSLPAAQPTAGAQTAFGAPAESAAAAPRSFPAVPAATTAPTATAPATPAPPSGAIKGAGSPITSPEGTPALAVLPPVTPYPVIPPAGTGTGVKTAFAAAADVAAAAASGRDLVVATTTAVEVVVEDGGVAEVAGKGPGGADGAEEIMIGGVSLVTVLTKGMAVAKVVIEKVGSNLPFPGSEASELVLTLMDLVEKAIANQENLRGLRERAVAVLDILAAYQAELCRVRKYKAVVEAYKELLEGVTAYARAYSERNCLMRLLTANSDEQHYTELVEEMSQLSERVMLAVAADTNARLVHVQAAVEESRQLLRAAARYMDPAAGARALVAELGGLEEVFADSNKLGRVVKELDVSAQVTIEVITSMLASHLDKGPQRHIRHPDLRVFWKRVYGSEVEVPWFVFWADFPALLRDNPMAEEAVEELVQLLADEHVRSVLERAVEKENTKDRVSVWELKVAFSGDKGLAEQIRGIVAMALQQQQLQGAMSSVLAPTSRAASRLMLTQAQKMMSFRPAAAAAAAVGTLPALPEAGGAKPQPGPPPPLQVTGSFTAAPSLVSPAGFKMAAAAMSQYGNGSTAEGEAFTVAIAAAAVTRRQLPPLVSNYQGRDGEAAEVVAHLETHGSTVLVAPGGLGKSCLASDVGWRLVRAGKVPGGALWVDLRDADMPLKVEARFCVALGLQPETEGNKRRIAAAAKALCGTAAAAAATLAQPRSMLFAPPPDSAAEAAPGSTLDPTSLAGAPPAPRLGSVAACGASTAAPASGMVPMAALIVVDNAEDALLQADARGALLGILEKLLKEVPAVRLLITSRNSVVKSSPPSTAVAATTTTEATGSAAPAPAAPPPAPPSPLAALLHEHRVGSIEPGAAAQLVLAVAADLTVEEAARVAECCQYVPLVLCLAADALVAGRLTIEDLEGMAACLDEDACGREGPGAAAAASDDADSMRHIVTVVLGSMKRQHALFAAQLAVFPSAFDYEEAAAVTDLSEAQVHALLALLYRHSIVQRGGGALQFVMHSLVREHVATLARRYEPVALARAEGRFVRMVMDGLREWAAMYKTAKEWQLALCMARGHLPNISKTLDLLREGATEGAHLDLFAGAKRRPSIPASITSNHHQHNQHHRGSLDLSQVSAPGHAGADAGRDGFHKAITSPLLPSETTQEAAAAAAASSSVRGWDPLAVAKGMSHEILVLMQDLFLMMRLRPACEFILKYLTAAKDSLHPPVPPSDSEDSGSPRHPPHPAGPLYPGVPESEIDLARANVLFILARMYQLHGDIKVASAFIQECLDIRRSILGVDNPDTATALEGRAFALHCQGRDAEAESLLRQSLEIRERLLGSGSDTASSYSTLAMCVDKQGRHAEAEPLFRKALEMWRATLGEDHAENAASLNHLAQCLQAQDRHAEAEQLNRQALELRLRVLGQEHLATSLSVLCLAQCISQQGRHGEAEPLYRQVLELRQRLLMDQHPAVVEVLEHLASCVHLQGREGEARALQDQVAQLRAQAAEAAGTAEAAVQPLLFR